MNFKYVIVLFILVLVSSVSFVSATDSSFSEIDNANFKSNQSLYEDLEVQDTNKIENNFDLKKVNSDFIEDTSNITKSIISILKILLLEMELIIQIFLKQ